MKLLFCLRNTRSQAMPRLVNIDQTQLHSIIAMIHTIKLINRPPIRLYALA